MLKNDFKKMFDRKSCPISTDGHHDWQPFGVELKVERETPMKLKRIVRCELCGQTKTTVIEEGV